jgi:hypothetical protein
MQTKTADSKGRVTLGRRFANKPVIIREVDKTEVVVTLARVIPEREAWLFHDRKARDSVLRGLTQARSRDSVEGPDLDADAKLADKIEDET